MAAPIGRKAPEIADSGSGEAGTVAPAPGNAGRLRRLFSFSRNKGLLDAPREPVKREKKEEKIAAAGEGRGANAENRADGPAAKTSFLESLRHALRLFNPAKVYRRFREDLGIYRKAKKEARELPEESLVGKPDLIRSVIELRMGAAVAGSEITGTYILAPIVGGAFQVATGNAYWGILGTVIGDYFPAVISFQAIWLGLNLKYYSNCADTFWGKVKRFYKDVLPLHGAAVLATIPAYAASSTVSATLITAINAASPGLANSLPIPLLALVNIGVAEAIFLTLVGNMLPRLMGGIVDAYRSYLERKYATIR